MNTPPFVATDTTDESVDQSSLDFSSTCPSFEEAGECRLGLKCRFLGAHARVDENGTVALIVDEEKKSRVALTNTEFNQVSAETLKLLRQNKVCLSSRLLFLDFGELRDSTRDLSQTHTSMS